MKNRWKEFKDPVAVVAVVLFAGLIVMTVFQVASRYIFQAPISFTEEVGRILFIWVSFLGAALVMKDNDHMNLDLLTGHVGEKSLRVVRALVLLLIAAFCSLMLITGLQLVRSTTTQYTSITRIQMSYIYLILPLSAVYMLIFAVVHLVRTLRERSK